MTQCNNTIWQLIGKKWIRIYKNKDCSYRRRQCMDDAKNKSLLTNTWFSQTEVPVVTPFPPKDTRKIVPKDYISRFPYHAICQIIGLYSDQKEYVSTGWLVDRRTVITAGHVLFPKDKALHLLDLEIRPGRFGKSSLGRHRAIARRAMENWEISRDMEEDIGAIRLDSPVDKRITPLNFRCILTDKIIRDKVIEEVNIVGYPIDRGREQSVCIFDCSKKSSPKTSIEKSRSQIYGAGNYPYYSSGITKLMYKDRKSKKPFNRLFYQIDTCSGQSGSPLYLRIPNNKGRNIVYVVGVHSANYKEYPGSMANSATLITPKAIKFINKFISTRGVI